MNRQPLLARFRLAARRRRLARGRSPRVPTASILLLLSLACLAGALVGCFRFLEPESPGGEVFLTQVRQVAAAGQLERATVLDEDARVVLDVRGRAEPAWVAYPRADVTSGRLIEDLVAAGVNVRVDPQTTKGVVRIVATVLLPLLMLANLFSFLFVSTRGRGSALGEIVTFSKLRRGGGSRRTGSSTVTFDDVAGLEEAVDELREVVDYLANPERYRAMAAKPPKGVLLFGPPGCGKTLLARATAGEAEVPFFAVAGAEFVESLVGVGAARVRDLFSRVRAVAPAIVFIDELDATGRRRSSGGGAGGSDERDQTLNQLLVEMDGFDASSGIVVMAATNRPDILDPALLRPGRFDRHLTIDGPDQERRHAILQLHSRGRPLAADVDLRLTAQQTPGFSGADVAGVMNEAALLAIRRGESRLSARTVADAVERVRSGPQPRATLLTPSQRRRVAVYEAGRAFLLALTGRAHELNRLSTVTSPNTRRSLPLEREEHEPVLTRAELEDRLAACLGGRAAEELLLDEASTIGERDLADATELATALVARFGMSGAGPRRYVLPPETGADGALDLLSPALHATIDAEIRAALDAANQRAMSLLRQVRRELVALVDRLDAYESVDGPELDELLPPPAPRQGRRKPARTAGTAGSGGAGRDGDAEVAP